MNIYEWLNRLHFGHLCGIVEQLDCTLNVLWIVLCTLEIVL